MNYYEQLLESYSLLKQRKLRIVSEQVGQNDQELVGLIQDLGKGRSSEDAGEQNGVFVFQGDPQGKPNVYTGSLGKGGFSAFILDGNTLDPNNSKTAKKILDRLRGGTEDAVLDSKEEELDAELEQQEREEQFLEDEPLLARLGFQPDELLPDVFTKVKTNLNKYFENIEKLSKVSKLSPKFGLDYYVYGGAEGSLSKKLSRLANFSRRTKTQEVILNPEIGAIAPTESERLDRGDLVAGTTDTLSEMQSYAIESEDIMQDSDRRESVCASIQNKLKKTGSWDNPIATGNKKLIVLHSNDATRGISMSPSIFDQNMVERLEKLCGGPLAEPEQTSYSFQSLAEFRGKTAETLTSLNNLARNMSSLGLDKDEDFVDFYRGKVRELFNKNIEKSRAAFAWLAEVRTGAADLDDHHLVKLLEDNVVDLGTPEGIKNVFVNINALGELFRSQIIDATGGEADAIVQVGKNTGWGYKADTAICFHDKSRATKLANKLNAQVTTTTYAKLMEKANDPELTERIMNMHGKSMDDEVHSVGDSLKAYMEYNGSKLSDLTGLHLVSEMLNGHWGGRGKPEHLDKVKQELGMSDAQQKAAARYWDNGPGRIHKIIEDQFTAGEYFDSGKLRAKSPKQAAAQVMETLKKQKGMNFSTLSESEFTKIFTTGPKDNPKMVDMDDPVVQERVKEQLQRLMVTAKFNSDLTSGRNQTEARHCAAFMVWTSCGSYYDDAYDVRDLKTMESYLLNQNDSVRDLGMYLMGKNDNYSIEGLGYTTKFKHKESGGSISINRGGKRAESKAGYKRVTVQSFIQDRELTKHYAKQYSSNVKTESLIKAYIEGQMGLLEQLAKEYSK